MHVKKGLRFALIIISALYLNIYTGLRTMQFGMSLGMLAMAAACAVLALIIAGVLMRGKFTPKSMLIPVMLVIVLTVMGESYAIAQEQLVIREHGADGKCAVGTYIQRWPPFSNSAIYCGKFGDWVGND